MPSKKSKKKGKKKGNKNQGKKKNPQSKKQNKPKSEDNFLDSILEKKEKSEEKEIEYDISKGQTSPDPMIPIEKLFPNGDFPIARVDEYPNMKLSEDPEKEKILKERDEKFEETYKDMRKSGEAHRHVRKYVHHFVKPGMKMYDIANKIEDKVELLTGFSKSDPLKSGLAFPIGLSLNNCAAHYTPNSRDKRILKKDDVMKVDIGTHFNGYICDSAFTMAWNEKYDNLLKAVKEATYTGVKEAGIDASIDEIGCKIQEVMESYEVEIDGKNHPVKVIRNLCGHGVGQYKIHTGVTISCCNSKESGKRLKENHFYALETFGSIMGKGYVESDPDCSHFMMNFISPPAHPNMNGKEKKFYDFINKRFSTLCFSRRYLDRIGQKGNYLTMKNLVNKGILCDYPPLSDVKESYVAQFEHTLMLKSTGKEVISWGDDY